MITAKLEEMIWKGEAQAKTWTIGTGASGLNVKENTTVIILAVDYFGFLDSGTEISGPNNPLWREKMNKMISFYSKSRRHNLLARSFYTTNLGLQSSHHRYEMYWPFTENINCNIGSFEPINSATFVVGSPPNRSGSAEPPLGYGNENSGFGAPSVILELETNSVQEDEEVVPYPDTRPTHANAYHDYQLAFSTDSILLIPHQSTDHFGEAQFPMMTVHYVEKNKRLTAKFA